jgi:DNA-binding MarR family transcriptional regulator
VSRENRNSGFKPITVLMRQLQNAMRHATEQVLLEAELTPAQASALTELAYGAARSNAELARAGFVAPQTMVEILMALERRGLIVRKAQAEGGRAMLAELTKEGSKAVLAVHLAMRQVEERLLGALPAEDVSRLRHLLQKCLAVLESPDRSRHA